MKKLKIRVEDIDIKSPYLIHHADFFINLLRQKYEVEILRTGKEEPDILFYSCWGMNNLKWRNSVRIYFTAEQDIPDFNLCDYAIGLANVGMPERFMHFPFYVFYNDLLKKLENQQKICNYDSLLSRKFCSTVISGPMRHPIYFEILNQLNSYKKIDSGGKRYNNIGKPVTDKLSFIKNYKFNLAIENLNVDGYITEKLPEAFVAQTIPIYWGSAQAKKEFGEGGYINISDFRSLEEALEFIMEVDNDDDLYLKILKQGPQPILSYVQWCEKLTEFLVNAIESGKKIYDSGIYNVIFNERQFFYKIRNSLPGRLYRKYQRLKSKL